MAAEEHRRAAAEVKPSIDMPARSETILLVEDDAVVRAFVSDLLVEWGYRVLEASGEEEALRHVTQHQGPIHLLITDVTMAGMNGRQLAEQIRRLRPDTRVLFMSGYADDHVIRQDLRDTKEAFLQKPFDVLALDRAMRAVLDAPRERSER